MRWLRRWVDGAEDFQNGSVQANAVIFDKSPTLTFRACASLLARPNLVAIRPRNAYTRFGDLWRFPRRLRLLVALAIPCELFRPQGLKAGASEESFHSFVTKKAVCAWT